MAAEEEAPGDEVTADDASKENASKAKATAPKPTRPKRKPKVAPLLCASCGASVRLGVFTAEANTASCRACGASVSIPPPHVALRDAAKRDAESSARATELAGAIVAPPGALVGFWTTCGMIALLVAVLIVLAWLVVSIVMCIGTLVKAGLTAAMVSLLAGFVLGLPLMVNELQHGLAHRLGVDWADTLSPALTNAIVGGLFYFGLAVPMILAAYADAFETVRATLRTILAARPPSTEGGASECRDCGAALELAQGAAACRCVYCGADNLVAVPKSLLQDVKHAVDTRSDDVASAAAEIVEAKRRERRRLAKRLAWWLLLVPGFVLLGRGVAGINGDGAMYFQSAKPTAKMWPRNDKNPTFERGTSGEFTVVKTFDRCDERQCDAYYFVALEKGERLDIAAERGELWSSSIQQREIGSWYNPAYGWIELEPEDPSCEGPGCVEPLPPRAPYTGWYRVTLSVPKGEGPVPVIRWSAKK